MNTESTEPMSRRDVWLTIALAVAKGEIAAPDGLEIVDSGAVWISYRANLEHTIDDAIRTGERFGATEKYGPSPSGVFRWCTPAGARINVSVWWHGSKPEPEARSPLAEQVIAAVGAA